MANHHKGKPGRVKLRDWLEDNHGFEEFLTNEQCQLLLDRLEDISEGYEEKPSTPLTPTVKKG